MGNVRAANTVMLGFWTAAVGAVTREAMQYSLTESVPPKTVEINMKAFEYGYNAGLKLT
jgi:Pyruvate/2-oxoacid:ferredoxin oxidoreductase gamma subunit